MTDIQAQSVAYAVSTLNGNNCESFNRQEMYYALRDAYGQGWIDCDTKDDKPDTEAEFFEGKETE